jgi:hypothetical protein
MANKLHLGFKETQAKIAKKQGISMKAAGAILADSARKASPEAVRKNPALLNVKRGTKKYVDGGKTGAQMKAEGIAMKAKGKQMKGEGMAAKVVGTMQKNMNTAKPANKTVDAVMNVVGMVASPSGPAKAAQAVAGLSRMAKLAPKVKSAAKSLTSGRANVANKVSSGLKTTNPVARRLGLEAGKKDMLVKTFRSGKTEVKKIIKDKKNPQTKLKLK